MASFISIYSRTPFSNYSTSTLIDPVDEYFSKFSRYIPMYKFLIIAKANIADTLRNKLYVNSCSETDQLATHD